MVLKGLLDLLEEGLFPPRMVCDVGMGDGSGSVDLEEASLSVEAAPEMEEEAAPDM